MIPGSRLSFTPQQYNSLFSGTPALRFATDGPDVEDWIPVLYSTAHFPVELFVPAMMDLINHPEYNSSLILRAEVEFDHLASDLQGLNENLPITSLGIEGMQLLKVIRRRLLARRPQRDPSIRQDCSFFTENEDTSKDLNFSTEFLNSTVCILTPLLQGDEVVPYYHPRVKHIAFRYLREPASPIIRIEVVPLDPLEVSFPVDQESRLYRTCLALLDALHRYGLGRLSSYKKRVFHDQVIPREEYQDLYLIMRERHKDHVKSWHEVTDPLKHVFEDIGIATYLMLLWKETYKPSDAVSMTPDEYTDAPWGNWPRPPGGFVDIGCGNGLLVHILTSEGYIGYGFDVRSRTSWSHYPKNTQDNLRVTTFDPSQLRSDSVPEMLIPSGSFIIANHADELTPWTPIMATLSFASGYLSIPCCAWMFDRKFNREQAKSVIESLPGNQSSRLNLGKEGLNGSYARYRRWLASISWQAGWEIECDSLRIPSTRNWAIIGRTKRSRSACSESPIDFCKEILEQVSQQGQWKARTPESKRSHIFVKCQSR